MLDSIDYTPGTPAKVRVHVTSHGARTRILLDWATKYNEKVDILPDGIYITLSTYTSKRNTPNTISAMQDIIANMIDRLSYVLPGNNLAFGTIVDRKVYTEANLKITFTDVSPFVFDLIGKSISNLPLVLDAISLKMGSSGMSGTITLKALGN